jgi:hypothetical protein
MFGIKSFASIINEPQGAIMSVGVGEKRPVVRGDKIEIATVMSVTLDLRSPGGGRRHRRPLAGGLQGPDRRPDHDDRLRPGP